MLARRPMSKGLFLSLGIALAVGTSGCSALDRSDTVSSLLERTAANQAITPLPPLIRLVEPGPPGVVRRKLRYRFDQAQRGFTQVDIRSISHADGAKAMGTLRFVVGFEPKSVTPGGDYRFGFEIARAELLPDAETPDDVVEKMNARLDEVRRLWGTALVSERGVLKEFGWRTHNALSVPAHQVLVDLSRWLRSQYPPLPEEEVGVGARWEVSQQVVTNAYDMTTKTAYALQMLDDKGAEIGVSLEQTAPPQVVRKVVGKGEAKKDMRLENVYGVGEGTFQVRFQPPRASSELRLEMRTHVTVSSGAPVSLTTASQTIARPLEAP